MVVPNAYQTTSGLNVNYNFTDVVSKTGYLTFYCVGTNAGGYSLVPLAIESDAAYAYTTDSSDAGGDTVEKDLDFDFTFVTPQTIRGRLYVALSMKASNDVSAYYCKVTIIHYDGSTETTIGTAQNSSELATGSGDVVTREMLAFDIARKHFRKGDTLRVNIQMYATIGATGSITLYHDGENRNINNKTFFNETLPTDLKVLVPFEVEG